MRSLLKSLWSKRKKKSHKRDNGTVLVIGGSEQFVGAVALAGVAALRVGADLAIVAAPEKVAWAINCLSPDLITSKFKGKHFTLSHVKKVLQLAKKADVVLIGNGLGNKSGAFVNALVKKLNKPLVLDADAIKFVKNPKNAILTPHGREFEIYSGKKLSGNLKIDVKMVQKASGSNVILLKGNVDIIASQKSFKLNRLGNPGMTKGGTGDVVAGICAGLLAQGMKPFDAAYESARIASSIGDKLAKKKGYSFLASDMLKDLKKYKC